jgi:hypothetical protein
MRTKVGMRTKVTLSKAHSTSSKVRFSSSRSSGASRAGASTHSHTRAPAEYGALRFAWSRSSPRFQSAVTLRRVPNVSRVEFVRGWCALELVRQRGTGGILQREGSGAGPSLRMRLTRRRHPSAPARTRRPPLSRRGSHAPLARRTRGGSPWGSGASGSRPRARACTRAPRAGSWRPRAPAGTRTHAPRTPRDRSLPARRASAPSTAAGPFSPGLRRLREPCEAERFS